MQNFSSGFERQEIADVCFAVLRAHQRAVTDDHRQRRVEFTRDRHGEVVAAPGHQRHLDAAAGGFGNGCTVRLGQLPAAVQQRSVDVERDESYRHEFPQALL